MSEQTAQRRSCSDKPSGFFAPRGENGAIFGLLGLAPALKTGPGQHRKPRKGSEKRVRTRVRRSTMALHGSAAEPGQAKWEMSGEERTHHEADRNETLAVGCMAGPCAGSHGPDESVSRGRRPPGAM